MGARNKSPLGHGLDPRLAASLRAQQEALEEGEGRRGNKARRWLREEDLIKMGLARYAGGGGGMIGGGGVLVPTIDVPDMSVPPTPTGLEVTGLFNMILIRWDNGNKAYRNHSMTEIWRSTTNDRATAQLVGTTDSFIFSDVNVTYGVTYYYWIRFVSATNVTGTWNAVAGTPGSLAEDPGILLSRLQGEIRESHLYGHLNSRINLIDSPGTGLVTKVTEIKTETEALVEQLTTLTSDLNDNTTSISQLMSTTDGLKAQYSIKIDNNGFVSGFGLSSEPVNSQPFSMFLINADRFAVANPGANIISISSLVRSGTVATAVTAAPHGLVAGRHIVITGATPATWNGSWQVVSTPSPTTVTFVVPNSLPTPAGGNKYLATGEIPFVIDDGKVVMDAAFIKDATITNAKIQNIGVEKLIGNIGEFVVANIGTGTITSAMIDNQIQSTVYVTNQQGWAINKNGFAEFQNIRARGDIEATSIKADAANIVSTLNVAGGAVTSMLFAEGGGGSVAQKNGYRAAPSLTISAWNRKAVETPSLAMPVGSSGVVISFGVFVYGEDDNCQVYVDIFRNSVLIGSVTGAYYRFGTWVGSALFDASPATNNVYTMMISSGRNANGNGDRNFNFSNPTITLTGGKR